MSREKKDGTFLIIHSFKTYANIYNFLFLQLLHILFFLLGGFDSIAYGIPFKPVIDHPYVLSSRQCRRLVEDRVVEFLGHDISISDLDSFSAEVPLYGSYRRPDGTCSNGQPFKIKDTTYDSNWIIGSIRGKVVKQMMKYDPTENTINLEGVNVHLRKSEYEGNLNTYYWHVEPSTCSETVQKVYDGVAKYIIPRNPSLNKQIIVHDAERQITFALDLGGTKTVCGSEFYRTQITSIQVTFKPENFIKNLEENRHVDRIDNLIGK